MNKKFELQSEERLIFMDRLRLFLVVIVVFMHSACAYSNIIPWWSVQENPKSQLLDVFALFVDGFQMPLLFFISGYFAYFSITKRSRGEFIVSKIRRLGLPFVAVGLFLLPYISYVGVRRIMPNPESFFSFWIFQMKTIADFTPVLFSNHEMAMKHWKDYSDWHLWFVLLLVFFYVLYASFDFFREKISKNSYENRSGSAGNSPLAIDIALLVTVLFYILINHYVKEWVWGKTSIFSLQPVRLPVHMSFFFLGTYAGLKGWFVKREIPGKISIWGTVFIILSVALILCMFSVFETWEKPTLFSFSLIHGIVRAGVAFVSMVFLIKLASRHTGKNRLLDSASGYSYEIYLIHLPLVIAFAQLFTHISMPLILKFVIIGTLVTVISWALGRYLIRPYPKITCAVIGAVFALTCFVYS